MALAARDRPADDRRLPAPRRIHRGVGRDRARVGRHHAGPIRGAAIMSAHDERWTGNFLRGLTIGAIIGAVIAGSRIWRSLRGGQG